MEDADYALYRDLLAQSAERAAAEIWSYCLMPNHVHVIIVPTDEDGLRRTFAAFLGDPAGDEAAWKALRMSETSGRPLGSGEWLNALEKQTGRTLKPRKRGPKAKPGN